MSDDEVVVSKPKPKPLKVALIVGIALLVFVYVFTGFFAIQPIGAIPDGVTIWYFRIGSKMPFISSPDGMQVKAQGFVNLFGRMAAIGAFVDNFEKKIIARLPYSRALYLKSTGGKNYSE